MVLPNLCDQCVERVGEALPDGNGRHRKIEILYNPEPNPEPNPENEPRTEHEPRSENSEA
jgi:hypothetical protein